MAATSHTDTGLVVVAGMYSKFEGSLEEMYTARGMYFYLNWKRPVHSLQTESNTAAPLFEKQ